MIKFENTQVFNFEGALRGMRNPLNSWDNGDSGWDGYGEADGYSIGKSDLALAQKLIKAGSDHRKFMRQIFVSVDITAPLYWWKEFDTYKVGTVANSCSTMHTIHQKEIEWADFSFDRLYSPYEGDVDLGSEELAAFILRVLNRYRERYLETKNIDDWYQLIQLLPSSYNQRRTVTFSYENLISIYHARRNHKLDEWRVGFMDWIKTLPYAEELILI